MSAGRMVRFVRIAGPRIFRAMRMFGRIERAHPGRRTATCRPSGVRPALQGRASAGA